MFPCYLCVVLFLFFKVIVIITAKLYYIESQGTGVNGSIYSRFEISHIHLFPLIVAGPFTIVRYNPKFEILKFDILKFC